MKYQIQGGADVSLTQSNFLAAGGEGNVFVIGSTAYKIYSDPSKMIPEGKIHELAEIRDPHVIKPERLLLDSKGRTVGFTSKFVSSAGALCQTFTRAFRERNSLTPQDIAELVRALREIVQNVHSAHSLIVDLNEMNFLLGAQMKDLYAIDVGSYQTPHYKATALMESVRDRHMKHGQFSEMTDWFAFGIVSFQMFVGIHPFKGTHPAAKGLDERMQANLSVLHSESRVPRTCYPFSVIPPAYLGWYKSIFESSTYRAAPPLDMLGAVVIPRAAPVAATNGFDIREIQTYDSDIIGVWGGTSGVVATKNSVYVNGRLLLTSNYATRYDVGFTAKSGKPVIATLAGNQPVLLDGGGHAVPCGLTGDSMMSYGGQLFLKNRDKIVRFDLHEAGGSVIAAPQTAVNVLEHATKLFDGVVIQSLLGATYVSVFPTRDSSVQLRMPELDGSKIVDAKYDGGVLMVLRAKNGVYDRMVFRIDAESSTWDARIVQDITPSGLNFVTLDTGVCVAIIEDDRLELFSARKDSASMRTIEDKAITGGMRLYKHAGKVAFAVGSTLYSLSLR